MNYVSGISQNMHIHSLSLNLRFGSKKHNKSESGIAQKIAVLRHIKNAEIDLGNENWHVKNEDFFSSSKFALGHIFFVQYMPIGAKTTIGTILADYGHIQGCDKVTSMHRCFENL
jgi:hypothetical protein